MSRKFGVTAAPVRIGMGLQPPKASTWITAREMDGRMKMLRPEKNLADQVAEIVNLCLGVRP